MVHAGVDTEHRPSIPSSDGLADLARGIDPASLEAMHENARVRAFSRGECLVAQGEALPIVITLEGFVAVRRTDRDGHQYTLLLMGPDEIVGLSSTWRPAPSLFDLVAVTDGRALLLDGARVRELAQTDAALAFRLFDLAMGTLSLSLERLDEITFDDARTRFARSLLEYEPLLTGEDAVVSRDELASLVGTSREMLGSVIRAFEAADVLERHGRQIVILDHRALEAAADWPRHDARRADWLQVAAAHEVVAPDAAPRGVRRR